MQSMIFFCKYSHTLSYGNIPYNNYRKIFKVIDEANSEIEFDEEKVKDNILSGVIEQMIISAAKFIAKDDKLLLVKLRRDITLITLLDAREIRAMRLETLTAILLCEFVFLVKFCAFFPEKGIEEIWSSDSTIFLQ